MRNSKIESPPKEINVLIMLGGADIKVPEEWSVKMDVFPFLGGVSDDRSQSKRRKEEGEETDLIITGFVALGGISIKD